MAERDGYIIEPRWIVGFSGHRSGWNRRTVEPALESCLRGLKERAERQGGRIEIHSGPAEGADTACLEAARRLDLPAHLILPLAEDDFRRDFVDEAAWEPSRRQIELARRSPDRDTVRVAGGDRSRPACYYDAGIQMLEATDVLMAVWDGEPARGTGGTADIVAQARALGKPLLWIHAATGATTAERLPGDWPAPDPVLGSLGRLAASAGGAGFSPADGPEALKACLDDVAKRSAPRFRRFVVTAILLDAAAALLAAMAGIAHGTILIAFELGLVLLALGIVGALRWRRTREQWLQARFAVEILRSLRAGIPPLDPLRPLIERHAPEWRRFALSAGLLVRARARGRDDLDALKAAYIADRLDDQAGYFGPRGAKARIHWRTTRRLAEVFSSAAPLFVGFALVNRVLGWNVEKTVLGGLAALFMPIALPLLAASAIGFRSALDSGRRAVRYPEMADFLARAKARLAGLRTPSSVRAEILRCEEVLLDEVIEWLVVARNIGVH